jgi:hypothetical protein
MVWTTVAHALAEAGWKPDRDLEEWVAQALDPTTRYAQQFALYGVDRHDPDVALVRFWVEVSWDLYDRLVITTPDVPLDPDGSDKGLTLVARSFKRRAAALGARTECRLSLRDAVASDPVRRREAMNALRLAPGYTPVFHGQVSSLPPTTSNNVEEVTYGLDAS